MIIMHSWLESTHLRHSWNVSVLHVGALCRLPHDSCWSLFLLSSCLGEKRCLLSPGTGDQDLKELQSWSETLHKNPSQPVGSAPVIHIQGHVSHSEKGGDAVNDGGVVYIVWMASQKDCNRGIKCHLQWSNHRGAPLLWRTAERAGVV